MEPSNPSFVPPAADMERRMRTVETRQERHRTEQRGTASDVEEIKDDVKAIRKTQDRLDTTIRTSTRNLGALFIALILGVCGILWDGYASRKSRDNYATQVVELRKALNQAQKTNTSDASHIKRNADSIADLKTDRHRHKWQSKRGR